jgi:hypothetical protein
MMMNDTEEVQFEGPVKGPDRPHIGRFGLTGRAGWCNLPAMKYPAAASGLF